MKRKVINVLNELIIPREEILLRKHGGGILSLWLLQGITNHHVTHHDSQFLSESPIDAIFAIFTLLDHFTKLLQYYYNIITTLLQYFYNTCTTLLQYFYNTDISKYLKILLTRPQQRRIWWAWSLSAKRRNDVDEGTNMTKRWFESIWQGGCF